MQIAYNKSKRTDKILYIVIHDTGNKNKGADANAHFKYFNSADRQSSADIFVDDKVALRVNDYNKFYTWHCGDGKGKNGITNNNSVGVEICINSDGDYNVALENAVLCVKDLMKELNVPTERVVRHFDASGKLCPASMSQNDWAVWKSFKEMLNESDADIIKREAGLSDETMEYLKRYAYGNDLIKKLATAIKKRA
ncbi:MAG: N-acetylmuramoyl-L-alanine amidase [Clostridia bacterium]|nr:N-acetylmuramoyl-L-alanine amidase [Clostridia bacterium]